MCPPPPPPPAGPICGLVSDCALVGGGGRRIRVGRDADGGAEERRGLKRRREVAEVGGGGGGGGGAGEGDGEGALAGWAGGVGEEEGAFFVTGGSLEAGGAGWGFGWGEVVFLGGEESRSRSTSSSSEEDASNGCESGISDGNEWGRGTRVDGG